MQCHPKLVVLQNNSLLCNLAHVTVREHTVALLTVLWLACDLYAHVLGHCQAALATASATTPILVSLKCVQGHMYLGDTHTFTLNYSGTF